MNRNQNERKPIIIEDVVYFKQAEDGSIESLAEDTFYYTFLMEHADDDGDGESNRKAAEDFVCYEELYSYLVELGILGNSKYCLDWTPVGDYGACFTLNLTKVLDDYDLERLLKDMYQNVTMHKYIDTLINPVDGLKCDICGAVTLSRHIEFLINDRKITHCLACYPLDEDQLCLIRKMYKASGFDPYAGVRRRIEVINEASKVKIADGYTINRLLDEYRARQGIKTENPDVINIQREFQKRGLYEYDIFTSRDFGLLMINRKAMADIEIFSKATALTHKGDAIIVLFNVENAVYIADEAVKFANKVIGRKSDN